MIYYLIIEGRWLSAFYRKLFTHSATLFVFLPGPPPTAEKNIPGDRRSCSVFACGPPIAVPAAVGGVSCLAGFSAFFIVSAMQYNIHVYGALFNICGN